MAAKKAPAKTSVPAQPTAAARKPVARQRTATKTAVAKTAVAKTAVAKPAVAKTAVAKTAVAKTAVAKTAVAKPAVAKPAVAKKANATAAKTANTAVAKTARTASKATPAATTEAMPAAAPMMTGSTAGADALKHSVHDLAPRLRVKPQESPWTAAELAAVRAELEGDITRLLAEIVVAEQELAGLMRDGGDSAGDDQADVGTRTFERLQEMSLAENSREMLEQSRHALDRIRDGSFGICESCGEPIGKLRLQAFPRATLCMTCKQKQERR